MYSYMFIIQLNEIVGKAVILTYLHFNKHLKQINVIFDYMQYRKKEKLT